MIRKKRHSFEFKLHCVKQMLEQYPKLLSARLARRRSSDRISTGMSTSSSSMVGQLDVSTVIKASQAISSEIVLGKLLEKLFPLLGADPLGVCQADGIKGRDQCLGQLAGFGLAPGGQRLPKSFQWIHVSILGRNGAIDKPQNIPI